MLGGRQLAPRRGRGRCVWLADVDVAALGRRRLGGGFDDEDEDEPQPATASRGGQDRDQRVITACVRACGREPARRAPAETGTAARLRAYAGLKTSANAQTFT